MVDKVTPKGKGKDKADGKEKDGKEKKVKKGRVDFAIKESKGRVPVMKDGKPTGETRITSIVNDDGKLTAVPVTIKDGDTVIFEGYNPTMHKPLKKEHFADMPTFMLYQAFLLRFRGERMIEIAKKREDRAQHLLKFGDEATRKKAQKYARMKDQMEKLKAQLKAEGIPTDDEDAAE